MSATPELPFISVNGVTRPMTPEEFVAFSASFTTVYTDIQLARSGKLAEIRAFFEGVVGRLKQDVAAYELASWDTQREEYTRWVMDNSVPTPYVDGLVLGRGIDKTVLMGKIAAKITGFSALQGTQHHYEDLVAAATTVAEVNAITMPNM